MNRTVILIAIVIVSLPLIDNVWVATECWDRVKYARNSREDTIKFLTKRIQQVKESHRGVSVADWSIVDQLYYQSLERQLKEVAE